MADTDGDSGNNAGATGSRPTAWSGSSTPPDVYGNFSRPGLADDMMEASELERTAEDMSPPTDVRTAHVVRQSLHNHLAELEESGEYDIRALAPLRHLLDQDWTDPNVRSRLKAKVEAEDARTAKATPETGTAPAKEWFGNSTESPATAETVQVPVMGGPAKTPGQTQVRPPTAPAAPPLQQRPATPGHGASPTPVVRPGAEAPKAITTAATRPPNPAAAAILPQTAAPATVAAAATPISAAKSPASSTTLPDPAASTLEQGASLQGQSALPAQRSSDSLVFDDEQKHAGQAKARSRALKLLSEVPTRAKGKRKVRPWIPAAGAFLVVAALALPESAFAGRKVAMGSPTFVLISEPKAEIFRGEERLGETPMLMQADLVGDGLILSQAGFESQTFTLENPVSHNKVERRKVVLNLAPVTLDWAGLPANSKLIWQGKPATVESLNAAMPGTYSLKATPPGRPAVTLSVVVPAPGSQTSSAPVALGKQIAQALGQQPALSMTIKAGKAKARLPLAVSITQTGGAKFSQTTSLDSKAPSKLMLPGPGTYQVKVPASATHEAFSQTFTVGAGAAQNLEIALTPVPPKATVAQAAPSGGGGSGYAPAPTYYAPPPVYYSGGGGGGGGRIAPPSF